MRNGGSMTLVTETNVDRLAELVGTPIRIEGPMGVAKIPTILGVEVEWSGAERVDRAYAEGILRAEDIDDAALAKMSSRTLMVSLSRLIS